MSDYKHQSYMKSMKTACDSLLTHLVPMSERYREGLLQTPKRMAKSLAHLTSGYDRDPMEMIRVFADGAENYNQIVMLRDIPVYSLCEHHCLPFFGKAVIGYIPSDKIIGLSKASRIVDVFARRLQVQERLTTQICKALHEGLSAVAVGVILACRHLCMEMRGIQKYGIVTTTAALEGDFYNDAKARAEFYNLINVKEV